MPTKDELDARFNKYKKQQYEQDQHTQGGTDKHNGWKNDIPILHDILKKQKYTNEEKRKRMGAYQYEITKRMKREKGSIIQTLEDYCRETINFMLNTLGIPYGKDFLFDERDILGPGDGSIKWSKVPRVERIREQSLNPMDRMKKTRDGIILDTSDHRLKSYRFGERPMEIPVTALGDKITDKVLIELDILNAKDLLDYVGGKTKEGNTLVLLITDSRMTHIFYMNQEGWHFIFKSWKKIFDEASKIAEKTGLLMPNVLIIDKCFTDIFDDKKLSILHKSVGDRWVKFWEFRDILYTLALPQSLAMMEKIEGDYIDKKIARRSRKYLGLASLYWAYRNLFHALEGFIQGSNISPALLFKNKGSELVGLVKPSQFMDIYGIGRKGRDSFQKRLKEIDRFFLEGLGDKPKLEYDIQKVSREEYLNVLKKEGAPSSAYQQIGKNNFFWKTIIKISNPLYNKELQRPVSRIWRQEPLGWLNWYKQEILKRAQDQGMA